MSEPRIMRMEPHGPADVGMTEWDTIPPEALTAGSPVQRGYVYHDDAKNRLTSSQKEPVSEQQKCRSRGGQRQVYWAKNSGRARRGSLIVESSRLKRCDGQGIARPGRPLHQGLER